MTSPRKVHEKLSSLKASVEEWPAYVVLRETLPPNLRTIVAALVAHKLGEREEFIETLSSIYETNQSAWIDDLYELPPGGSERFRRLIRNWLTKGNNAAEFLNLDVPMESEETNGKPEQFGESINILLQSGWVRFSSYEQLEVLHKKEHRLKNIVLMALADCSIELNQLLSGADQVNFNIPSDKTFSPFLMTLWLKHCGEQALLYEHPKLAKSFFELAEVKYQLHFPTPDPHVDLLGLQIRLSLIISKSLLTGAESVISEILELREKYKGRSVVDVIEYVRFHFGWEIDLAVEGSKYFSSSYPIEVLANETADELFKQPDAIIAKSTGKENNDSEFNFYFSAQRTIAAGCYPLLYDLREAWAWTLLQGKQPNIKEAMKQIVCSARGSAIQKFENWFKKANNIRLEEISTNYLDELARQKDVLPSQSMLRESAYVQILGILASSERIPDGIIMTLFDRLADYAINGRRERWLNISTKKPGLDGVFILVRNHIRLLLAEKSSSVVKVVTATLKSEYEWPIYEVALKIALKCVALLGKEHLVELTSAIVECLESRIKPSRGDWMLVGPAFAFLAHEKVAAILLAEQPELLAQARAQAQRYCLNEELEGQLGGWEQAFFVVKRLQMDVSGSVQRAIRLHLEHAFQSNATDSAYNISRLLMFPELLTDEQVIQTIEALVKIINWRSRDSLRLSPAIGSASTSVFNLAYHWKKICSIHPVIAEVLSAKAEMLFTSCMALFDHVERNPSGFAEFAFPRKTEPAPVIVHNWSYTLLSLALIVSQSEKARRLLSKVAKNDLLRAPINQAIGDFDNFGLNKQGSAETITIDEIDNLEAGAFYSRLGSMLARIAKQRDVHALLIAILNRCLASGPQIEDLGVLSMAIAVRGIHGTIPRDATTIVYQDKLLRLDRTIERNSMLMMNNLLETLLVPRSEEP